MTADDRVREAARTAMAAYPGFDDYPASDQGVILAGYERTLRSHLDAGVVVLADDVAAREREAQERAHRDVIQALYLAGGSDDLVQDVKDELAGILAYADPHTVRLSDLPAPSAATGREDETHG